MRGMTSGMKFKNLGYRVIVCISRFAGFDFKRLRLQESKRRRVELQKAILTAYVESDDEYFDDQDSALRRFPLTCLDDHGVNNVQLSNALSVGALATGSSPSLLEIVVSYLIKPLCPHDPVLDDAEEKCGVTQVQANDYVLERSWRKYAWQGSEWFHNSITKSWFWKGSGSWRAYRYKNAVWWLHADGKRWFWEVDGVSCVATTPGDLVFGCGSDLHSCKQLGATDYAVEQDWSLYSWEGSVWFHNAVTEEWFWKDDAGPWRCYLEESVHWWLNGKRCFWVAVDELAGVVTTPLDSVSNAEAGVVMNSACAWCAPGSTCCWCAPLHV